MADSKPFDFVVFGSGFGGSILSMVLRRLGYSVLLLEQGTHPRFVIGESSTPFANLLLEHLAEKYDLPFLRAFSEWGRWQKSYPQIACGLKRGFTFYHHVPGKAIDFEDRSSQMLVGASPNDEVSDTHWYRPQFDYFLVEQARKLGVVYLDAVSIEDWQKGANWTFRLESSDGPQRVSAKFAIDASGAKSVLARLLEIPAQSFASFPRTCAIYAHFGGVPRLADLNSLEPGSSPYPVDDAAVHHVFAEGWIWVLRFNNGITSAGAALNSERLRTHSPPEGLWRELIQRYPTLRSQFAAATAVTPFSSIPQLSFRRSAAVGEGWALLPSAAGFVDPLLSTGFALNLLGICRLAEMFLSRVPDSRQLETYQRSTFTELDAVADLVGAMYAKMHSFSEFAALSLLYFAALSFTESAWRLNRSHLADQFLLANDAGFTRGRRHICALARDGGRITPEKIAELISPWDIAGLGDLKRRNHYPIRVQDLLENCHKLGVSTDSIVQMVQRLGFPGLAGLPGLGLAALTALA